MDRLICGDVGYGKTEVAVRAAFKAVMDGKQVAVLVPTTVLAQQHFQTFQRAPGAPSRCASRCSPASARRRSRRTAVERTERGQGGHRHRHAPPAAEGCARSRTWAC